MSNKEKMKQAFDEWMNDLIIEDDIIYDEMKAAFNKGWELALKSIYFDPDRQMALIWSIEDVKSLRADLTDEQCMEVLRKTSHEYDSDIGVNWNTIQIWADELFPEKEEEE